MLIYADLLVTPYNKYHLLVLITVKVKHFANFPLYRIHLFLKILKLRLQP